jgi:hypothetical protein
MVREIPMRRGRFGLLEQMVGARGSKPQIQRNCRRATNDVGRSRRALKLLFANWLAQVDKLAAKRAPIVISTEGGCVPWVVKTTDLLHVFQAQPLSHHALGRRSGTSFLATSTEPLSAPPLEQPIDWP